MHISTYSVGGPRGAPFVPCCKRATPWAAHRWWLWTLTAPRAYPMYDWMGVMKSGARIARPLPAREVGTDKIRVNMLAAGPIRTMAAQVDSGIFAL